MFALEEKLFFSFFFLAVDFPCHQHQTACCTCSLFYREKGSMVWCKIMGFVNPCMVALVCA
jgi:hypothetical protein